MELAREHNLFRRARHTQVQQSMIKAEKLSRRMSLQTEKIKQIREIFAYSNPSSPEKNSKKLLKPSK